ncbi:hypothetical protein LV75_005662 [Actinokineospora diospyrosa]|uniref:Uncharacterized protein n=1 Tax=Actinokineospora diospyrosa TaxID=103728 RepID=A0ABT1ILQ8_9PSEU|nr:hypothetical protein [Actinokineospora diospyrosa]
MGEQVTAIHLERVRPDYSIIDTGRDHPTPALHWQAAAPCAQRQQPDRMTSA